MEIDKKQIHKSQIHTQRNALLYQVQKITEPFMIVLGVLWLVLLLVDLLSGISPHALIVSNIIWAIFIFDFIVKLLIAPSKIKFIKANILTVISLVIPALRIFRIISFFRFIRMASAARTLRLARIITSLNRGIKSLNLVLRRRAFGYIMLITVIVIFVGAAGIYAFEKKAAINNYAYALWWTAMIVTTMGSESWPETPEGRLLCLLLAIYGFAIFGYITATIASFFVGRDASSDKGEIAGTMQIKLLESKLDEVLKELNKRDQ